MGQFVPPVVKAARTSRMAVSSLVLGISSILCSIITGLPAIVLGIVALVRIKRSSGMLRGAGLAIGGIAMSAVTSILLLPFFVALGLPIIEAQREASRLNASMSQMVKIGMAMHDHADYHHAFPAPGGGTSGSQLSWRVRILPYVGEQELYDQFHHDEPWDSEHNRKLVAKMPAVYRDATGALSLGETRYLAVTGPGTAFGGTDVGPTYAEFKDGASRTILFVEADRGVVWTKPKDFTFDATSPTLGLGAGRRYRFLAAMADGHVRAISISTDPNVIRAMMTRAGGDWFEWP